jgi:hypothetical protein
MREMRTLKNKLKNPLLVSRFSNAHFSPFHSHFTNAHSRFTRAQSTDRLRIKSHSYFPVDYAVRVINSSFQVISGRAPKRALWMLLVSHIVSYTVK